MDFQLNEDQVALQEGIRSFASGQYAFDRMPEIEKQPLSRDAWNELAEMGVFSLRLSEADGGVGLGMVEAVVVFQELAKRLAPGPLLWSHLAAGLVDGAATGDQIVGGLDLTRPSSDPLLLEYGDQLDAVLVLRPDGVYRVDPSGLEMRPVGTALDPLTPMQLVTDLPQGELVTADAERFRARGTALASALMLGVAEATLEYANDYAKTREQFDRPIGSFQAIKHMLADMYVRLGQVRCATYAAGATLDDPGVGDQERAVSSAKVVAGEAAMKNARACVQIYGGMGYTWELPPHYYLKRVFVLEHAFGTIDEHAERVAESLAA